MAAFLDFFNSAHVCIMTHLWLSEKKNIHITVHDKYTSIVKGEFEFQKRKI